MLINLILYAEHFKGEGESKIPTLKKTKFQFKKRPLGLEMNIRKNGLLSVKWMYSCFKPSFVDAWLYFFVTIRVGADKLYAL